MRGVVFTGLGLTSAAALSAAALALAGSGGEPVAGFFSNSGTPLSIEALSAAGHATLVRTGATRDLRLLGTRGPAAFYIARNDDGDRCFLTGSASGGPSEFTTVFCPRARATAFPSDQRLILDASSFVYDRKTDANTVTALFGFAVDGVARVGVLDAEGQLHATPVVDNIYATTAVPSQPVVAIVALDRKGNRVVTIPLVAS